VSLGQRDGSLPPYSRISRPDRYPTEYRILLRGLFNDALSKKAIASIDKIMDEWSVGEDRKGCGVMETVS
jgi:hypothetical protein